MIRYGSAILLSAFLLFLIQPLVAKKLLPELGGTATIWTTCVMFFQIALFLGYLYAHLIRKLFKPRTGWLVHLVVIGLATAALFIQPFQFTQSATGELSWAVTKRLLAMIALPFVVLAATSPLVQAWHSVSHPSQQTYRLYALSNAGSLLALLTYPFIFDPLIGIATQSIVWNIAFCFFATSMLAAGSQLKSNQRWPAPGDSKEKRSANARSVHSEYLQGLVWLLLAANGSILLIATSNILCQEVASFPFLWLLPLVCYLVTMIICFDSPQFYQRWFFQPAFAASCFLAIVVFHFGANIGLIGQSIGCCAVLFTGCMICHGELVRLRPNVERLTQFYLAVALGGAVGGIIAVVLAPRLFNRFSEFHVSLLLVALLSSVLFVIEHVHKRKGKTRRLYVFLFASGFAAVPVICSLYFYLDPALNQGVIFQGRNDYGLTSVKQTEVYRIMKSGSTNHGGQFLSDELKQQPFAYYARGSGAERAFSMVRGSNKPLSVGVIGLGTGSLLNHGQSRDRFRFYEINPMVEQVANDFFDYLPASNATVVLGDGRMELQREFVDSGSNEFDLLFLDAFSSDSIPVHLLTRECFDLYLQHLKNNGIIVAHITNKFVDLEPVLAAVAKSHNLSSVRIQHRNERFDMVTDWILLSPNSDWSSGDNFETDELNWMNGMDELVWTDDHSSVFPIVRWTRRSRTHIQPRSDGSAQH